MITVTKVVNGIQYHCVSMPSSSSSVKSSTWWIIALIVTCVITIQIQLIVIFSIDSASEVDLTSGKYCQKMISTSFVENMTSTELLKRWSDHTRVKGKMLAVRRQDKGYMAMGVVVSGCRGSNSAVVIQTLRQTIGQLVNNTSTHDKLNNVVVVVILSGVDSELRGNTIHLIVEEFFYSVRLGFIHVIQQQQQQSTNSENYCLLGDRGVDIAAMSVVERYVARIAQHYLHVGSTSYDIEVSLDFVDDVRGFIKRETLRRPRGPMWTVLEFGPADSESFIGTLMRSTDLAHFATFFNDFQKTDFTKLYSLYLDIVSQRVRAIHFPALLQRSGYNKDEQSGRPIVKPWTDSDDPPAVIMTSMTAVDPYLVQLVYASSGNYFRAKSPTAGDWIAIVFESEVEIKSIRIQTGLPSGQFPAQSGFVEASPRLLKIDNKRNSVVCADFVRVGVFGFGATEFNEVSKLLWERPTRCLQLTLTSDDGSDVVFHQIAVYV